MKTIEVNASGKYKVHIGSGILNRAAEITLEVKKPCEAVIVSDDIVYSIYGKRVRSLYEAAGFSVKSFVFPNGESSKNMETITGLLEFMAEEKLTRTDLLLALGGGVTGDMTGFAAAVYLRGIDYLQIPTTLLAAVDSSVGGKTGVDLAAGKNLAGSFHQPISVICDTEVFKTLPKEIFLDGLCEAVKCGCISDKNLFNMLLEGNIDDRIDEIVAACVNIKRELVEKDEFDTAERQLLNFGHTVAHAVEVLSGYMISHGRAVAMGMVIMAHGEEKQRISELFTKYGVDINCPFSAKELAQKAMSDKKRGGKEITVVLLEEIGRAYLKKIGTDKLEELFGEGLRGGIYGC